MKSPFFDQFIVIHIQEAKMFSVVNELLQTRRELNELKEQLRTVS